MADYSKMTTDEFTQLLQEVIDTEVKHYGIQTLFTVEGFYEAVSEHYNNDVLDLWAKRNPELAYPEDDAEEEDDEDENSLIDGFEYRAYDAEGHHLARSQRLEDVQGFGVGVIQVHPQHPWK